MAVVIGLINACGQQRMAYVDRLSMAIKLPGVCPCVLASQHILVTGVVPLHDVYRNIFCSCFASASNFLTALIFLITVNF